MKFKLPVRTNGRWSATLTKPFTPQCSFNFQYSLRKPVSDFKKRRSLKVAYRQYGAGGQTIYKTLPGGASATFELKSGYSAGIAF